MPAHFEPGKVLSELAIQARLKPAILLCCRSGYIPATRIEVG